VVKLLVEQDEVGADSKDKKGRMRPWTVVESDSAIVLLLEAKLSNERV
jgi:hypothetical protein